MTHAAALCSGGLITIDCLPSTVVAARHGLNVTSLGDDPVSTLVSDRPSMEELQRRYLRLILTEVGGNRRRAASMLGLNRRTIQRLIARYDLFSLAEKDGVAEGESEIEHDDPSDEDTLDLK